MPPIGNPKAVKDIIKKVIVKILEIEARILIHRTKPKIIGVAGSVGKTSTKDAIYHAISRQKKTRRSEKSFNSEFGLPLTILNLPSGWNSPVDWLVIIYRGLLRGLFFPAHKYPEILVLEVGTDRPGDMDRVLSWLYFDIVVLTRCPEIPVHVEYFNDPHDLNEEDKKIVKGLTPHGTAVLNADDKEIMELVGRYDGPIVTYGYSSEAQVRATDEEKLLEKALGKQEGYPLLASLAVSQVLGLDLGLVRSELESVEKPKGRMNLIEGIHETLIIDDTYNSSPVAVEEALNVLGNRKSEAHPNSRRIAVLGDMMELGKYTEREHKRIGAYAKDHTDLLITVGLRAEYIATGAKEAHMHHTKIHSYPRKDGAIEYLKKHLHAGDIILIKGSQSSRMEEVVKALMKNPDEASRLLVRQEKEWQDR